MDTFVVTLASNPLYYIGALLALCAAVGTLLFLRGFGGGVPNIFHMRGHDEHVHHARVRIVWGFYICMVSLGVWEFIRVVLGEAPPSTLLFVIILLSPAWIPWLKGLITGKSGGGGGH